MNKNAANIDTGRTGILACSGTDRNVRPTSISWGRASVPSRYRRGNACLMEIWQKDDFDNNSNTRFLFNGIRTKRIT